jgi:Skp family chaperone for outer membrane proteins
MNSKLKPNWLIVPVLLLAVFTAFAQTPAPKPGQAAPATTAAPAGDIPKPKIALVTVEAFREGITELRALYVTLEAEFTPRRTELESMKSAVDEKTNVLQTNKALTPQQSRKLQDDIEALRKEGTRKLEDYQNDVAKREDAVTGETYKKVNDFLLKYVAEKGITQVWNTGKIFESGVVLYIDPKADITEDFIKEYNKANPGAAAPAGAARNAAPAPKKP